MHGDIYFVDGDDSGYQMGIVLFLGFIFFGTMFCMMIDHGTSSQVGYIEEHYILDINVYTKYHNDITIETGEILTTRLNDLEIGGKYKMKIYIVDNSNVWEKYNNPERYIDIAIKYNNGG